MGWGWSPEDILFAQSKNALLLNLDLLFFRSTTISDIIIVSMWKLNILGGAASCAYKAKGRSRQEKKSSQTTIIKLKNHPMTIPGILNSKENLKNRRQKKCGKKMRRKKSLYDYYKW